MLLVEYNLRLLIKKGQGYDYVNGKYIDDYKNYVRGFTGNLNEVLEHQNPLKMAIMVFELEKLIEIINPEFIAEIEWFESVKDALKAWHNDIVITNNTLGITNHSINRNESTDER